MGEQTIEAVVFAPPEAALLIDGLDKDGQPVTMRLTKQPNGNWESVAPCALVVYPATLRVRPECPPKGSPDQQN